MEGGDVRITPVTVSCHQDREREGGVPGLPFPRGAGGSARGRSRPEPTWLLTCNKPREVPVKEKLSRPLLRGLLGLGINIF